MGRHTGRIVHVQVADATTSRPVCYPGLVIESYATGYLRIRVFMRTNAAGVPLGTYDRESDYLLVAPSNPALPWEPGTVYGAHTWEDCPE